MNICHGGLQFTISAGKVFFAYYTCNLCMKGNLFFICQIFELVNCKPSFLLDATEPLSKMPRMPAGPTSVGIFHIHPGLKNDHVIITSFNRDLKTEVKLHV